MPYDYTDEVKAFPLGMVCVECDAPVTAKVKRTWHRPDLMPYVALRPETEWRESLPCGHTTECVYMATAPEGTRKCPDCLGDGYFAGHEPGCDGGRRCSQTCPVQERCETCRWSGRVPLSGEWTELEPEGEVPF